MAVNIPLNSGLGSAPETTAAINTLALAVNAQATTRLYSNGTSSGTPADTNEDILMSYSLPAGFLSTVGQTLEIVAFGTCAANGNNKTMKLYFGASVISSGTLTTNNKNWVARLTVIRNAASTQAVLGEMLVDTTNITPYFNAGSDTDTSVITIKVTGQSGTGTASDIVCKGLIVKSLY